MTKDEIRNIGTNVRNELMRRGLTTEHVAELIGHSARAVELQLGSVPFTEKNAVLYAGTFGFNKDYLLSGKGTLIEYDVRGSGERLTKPEMIMMIREHLNLRTNASFAAFLGFSPQRVSAWMIRGTFDPEILKAKCPELSGDWLLTGRGEMLTTATDPDAQREASLELAAQLKAENEALQTQNAKLLSVIETLAKK